MKIYDFPRDSRNRNRMPEVKGIDRTAQKIMYDAKNNGEDEGEMGDSPDTQSPDIQKKEEKRGKKKKKAVVS